MNIVEIMEQNELAKGFVPLHPGMAPWFPASDWHAGDTCSTDGEIVRMVALVARQPGTGAFRRLVDAIQARGMTPVVVEPVLDTMPAILERWGWERCDVGDEVQFWPPREEQV